MNQAIQFPDIEQWNAEIEAVCFHALAGGFQVNCAIAGETLKQRYGGETYSEWLSSFRQHRWDLEEEIELIIADGRDDAHGWFWIS